MAFPATEQGEAAKAARLRADLINGLTMFSGTQNYYVNPLGLKYTDGVKYLADTAGSYWLIDAIASHQHKRAAQANREFQLWILKRTGRDNEARLTMQRDRGASALISQRIEFTDFPLDEIKLYCCDGVLLLPGEY